MSDMRVYGLAFDRGIEEIVHIGKEAGSRHLPDRQNLPPSSDGVKAQLNQLLDKPNIAHFLAEALRPAVGNRSLLMPGKFSRTLSETLDCMQAAAETGPGDRRAIRRAVRLLNEEAGLRELAAMYRSALYQG